MIIYVYRMGKIAYTIHNMLIEVHSARVHSVNMAGNSRLDRKGMFAEVRPACCKLSGWV